MFETVGIVVTSYTVAKVTEQKENIKDQERRGSWREGALFGMCKRSVPPLSFPRCLAFPSQM